MDESSILTKSNWKTTHVIEIILQINWIKTKELYTFADSKNQLKIQKFHQNSLIFGNLSHSPSHNNMKTNQIA